MTRKIFFIADLHLDVSEEQRIEMFGHFLNFVLQQQAELYILGDLFNFWAGDAQAHLALFPLLLAKLKAFSETGNLYFLNGNRDFLFSPYWKRQGGNAIVDGTVLDLAENRILLYHGDALCTADIAYQRIRPWLQGKIIYLLSRLLPASLCLKIGRRLRRASKNAIQRKPSYSLRIDLEYVRQLLKQSSCTTMICGHAHHQNQIALPHSDQHHQLFILPECVENSFTYLVYHGGRFQFQEFLATSEK